MDHRVAVKTGGFYSDPKYQGLRRLVRPLTADSRYNEQEPEATPSGVFRRVFESTA